MIDARRMEVFTALYDMGLTPLMQPQPLILDSGSYSEWLDKSPVIFMGDGSDKAREVIKGKNAIFLPDVKPVAVDMMPLAEKAYAERRFLDLAYSVPAYLKEFQATKPKNPLT